MEHVVFFPAPDGSPSFRRVAALEDAVRLVEHLRNVEGVADVRVHALGAEVPLAFRAWYRVELPEPASAPAAEPPAVEPAHAAGVVPQQAGRDVPGDVEPAVEAAAVAVAVADAAPNGHADTPRSLGFFAT